MNPSDRHSLKEHISVFVSYSWGNEEHKEWVKSLAAQMRADGIDVSLDQWDLVPGDQVPVFMEKSVRSNDFVLVVCTPEYKVKSDGRKGGVGYEGDIITAEVLTEKNHRKFIPVLRHGDWESSAPVWALGKMYIDFRDDKSFLNSYRQLIGAILGEYEKAPELGAGPVLGNIGKNFWDKAAHIELTIESLKGVSYRWDHKIEFDGEPLGKIEEGSKFKLKTSPGQHEITVSYMRPGQGQRMAAFDRRDSRVMNFEAEVGVNRVAFKCRPGKVKGNLLLKVVPFVNLFFIDDPDSYYLEVQH